MRRDVSLVNIHMYAPNDDEKTFYPNFFDHELNFQCNDLITGGDFNLVLDLDKDKRLAEPKCIQSQTQLDGCMENLESPLISVYPAEKKNRSTLWNRFFLVSPGLKCNVTRADISVGYKTDIP